MIVIIFHVFRDDMSVNSGLTHKTKGMVKKRPKSSLRCRQYMKYFDNFYYFHTMWVLRYQYPLDTIPNVKLQNVVYFAREKEKSFVNCLCIVLFAIDTFLMFVLFQLYYVFLFKCIMFKPIMMMQLEDIFSVFKE